jgi:hypothetical protein
MALRSHDAKVAGLADKDAQERYENLLALEDDVDNPERANDLCDLAIRQVNHLDASVAERLVALRILGRLARNGVRTKDCALQLENHARPSGDRDFWCRIEALESLGRLAEGPQNAIPDETLIADVHSALALALRVDIETDRDVRIHAARELAVLRPESLQVMSQLVGALADEAPDVRYHAQRALIAIAGEDHGPTKQDWERWVRSQGGVIEPPRERDESPR